MRELALQGVVPGLLMAVIILAVASRLYGLDLGTEKSFDPNVALHAPALATSRADEQQGPNNLTDGDLETPWIAAQTLQDGPVAVVLLRKATPLSRVAVLPLAVPAGTCHWAVDLSADRRTWYEAGEAGGKGARRPTEAGWGAVTVPSTESWKFVRVRPLDWGRSGVGIFELRAFRR